METTKTRLGSISMTKIEKAVDSFKGGLSCSQAILSTFSAEFGLNAELALKISCPFGGGMGRTGQACGAVTGALMVIGLKFGQKQVSELQAKENTYKLVQSFITKFKSLHQNINCNDLIGFELHTPSGYEQATQARVFIDKCPIYVRSAAQILEEILSIN